MNLKKNTGREHQLSSYTSTEETNKLQRLSAANSESELFEKLREDSALFEQHINLILTTPGYMHLTRQEAEALVESMFRYATLIFEIVTHDSHDKDVEEQQTRAKHPTP